MKNSWQILTILLAVALVILSFKVTTQSTEVVAVSDSIDKESIAIENIMSRSSVRTYTDQKIEKEKIEVMLRAGMAAPTAGNRQPWSFIVIDDRAILDAIPPIIPGAHMAAKAQLAIAVLGTPADALVPEYWIQDGSAATENILLAANAMGLGAVWCGAFPDNANGKVAAMSELLGLPEGTYTLSIIVVGYPDSEPKIKDKWNESKVFYNRVE